PFLEYQTRMFTQGGGATAPQPRPGAHRRRDFPDNAEFRMLDLDNRAAALQLRIGQRLAEVPHRGTRHSSSEHAHPFVGRLSKQVLLHSLHNLITIPESLLKARELSGQFRIFE